MHEWLGKQAQDKITGFEGVIVGRVEYLFGCVQYGIASKLVGGKVIDTQYFDEGRIEILGLGVMASHVQAKDPGGDSRDCPKR